MDSSSLKENFGLRYLVDNSVSNDTLHKQATKYDSVCSGNYCVGSVLDTAKDPVTQLERRIKDATDFIDQYFSSLKKAGSEEHKRRKEQVTSALETKGTYHMTLEELTFGTRTAWRNAPRCIGRIQWKNLHVLDARNCRTARDMFEVLCKHLEYATNDGNIRSVITIFPDCHDPDHQFRVWNSQLIQYAGYKSKSGEVMGDPASVELTQFCERLGWRGKGGMFDVLPLLLQADGQDPEYFEIPQHLIMEVPLIHPEYPWFEKMGLKWYCVPAVANMRLDCGGLDFTACPFNGWYMGTEVGARDLCDVQRYNILPIVAQRMGLDTKRSATLWKDKAMVEINIAVLHSYQSKHVTIVDHHMASESFLQHFETETANRGGCPADWVWIVPPMSGSACGVFHKEMLKYKLKPSYEYQESAVDMYWKKKGGSLAPLVGSKNRLQFRVLARCVMTLLSLEKAQKQDRKRVTILYATETGRSLKFAQQLSRKLDTMCRPIVMCMEDYDVQRLATETFLLLVTSTFGDGNPPYNGQDFCQNLTNLDPSFTLKELRYSVFALGSSSYAQFCAFGHTLDNLFQQFGAKRICPLVEADENKGQEDPFSSWFQNVQNGLNRDSSVEEEVLEKTTIRSSPDIKEEMAYRHRLVKGKVLEYRKVLESLHGTAIQELKLSGRRQLGNNTGTFNVTFKNRRSKVSLLDYEPGDRLKIFPLNDPGQVQVILSRVNMPSSAHNTAFLFEYQDPATGKWMSDDRLPGPISLRQALTCFLDINAPVNGSILAAIQKKNGFSVSNDHTLNGGLNQSKTTFYELFEQMAPRSLDMDLLLVHLPLLCPRVYSISSCSTAKEKTISLTYRKISIQRLKETPRYGVCTSFLSRLPLGHAINCCLSRAEHFRLSLANSSPVLLVGVGTGIAPFRSFWQHKFHKMDGKNAERSNDIGPMHLYYGCRNSQDYYLYKDEIKTMMKNGVLQEVRLAFSRDKEIQKTYVQDVLLSNAPNVAHQIIEEQAYIYFCGNAEVWKAVSDVVVSILTLSANMTKEEASKYVRKMKSEFRLVKDIFEA